MATFDLILLWTALGVISGALAQAAHFKPAAWERYGWLRLVVLGAISALFGGLLGFWLIGRLFSSAFALWVAALMVCVPWAYEKAWRRRRGVFPTAASMDSYDS